MKLRLYTLILSIFFAYQLHGQDFGNALNFDGANDYVALPAGTAFNTADFTFEAWVKWDGPASNWQRIFDFGTGTGNNMFLTTQNSVNGKLRFGIRTPSVGEQTIDGPVIPADGSWHHIAVVLNDATNTGSLYVDGILGGSNTSLTTRPIDLGSTSNNWLGRSQFADPYFKGTIDEVKIWSTVRTAAQIQKNLTKLIGDEAGLITYYNFDKGTAGANNAGIISLSSNTSPTLSGTLVNFALTGATSNWVSSFPLPNFPVIEDFESGANGWTTGGTNNTWALGTPAKGVINGAHSGSKAWVTGGLMGSYGNNEFNWVQSPVYNFTNAVKPVVSLWIWRESESLFDGAILQQSINDGAWTNVGALNDPTNWYNGNTDGLASAGGTGWTGNGQYSISGSNGWVKAVHNLNPGLIGQTNVRFRILFGSDGTVVDDGFAFDDFTITMDRYPIPTTISQSDFGNALDFDGLDDFVRVPVDTFRQTPNGFTIETWVKWKSGSGAIFYVGRDISDFFTLDKTGLKAYGTNYNGGKAWSIPMNASIDNNWHHVAVTVDKVKNEGKIYLDGTLSGSFPNSIVIGKPLATQLWSLRDLQNQLTYSTIGRNESYSVYADIQLDEFRVWNYARSAKEININKSIPLSAIEPGIIYQLDFNEGIPSGNNNSITFLTDKVAGGSSEIFGFARSGSSSNFIKSNLTVSGSLPIITKVSPASSTAGKVITIYGANFGPTSTYNKVFFGTTEAIVVSVSSNVIKAIVPDSIGSVQKVSAMNSNGASNKVDFTVISPLSKRNFTFAQQEIYSQLIRPQSTAVADMNDDNLIDIVIAGTGPISILKNNGNKNYTPSVVYTSPGSNFYALSTGEMDNDGDVDIICKQGSDIILMKNNTTSWSKSTIATSIGGGTSLADIDSDGRLDVVTKNLTNQLGWLKNTGTGALGSFTIVDNSKKMIAVNTGDLNGDHYFDLVGVEEGPGQSYYKVYSYINNGAGTFTEYLVGSGVPYGDLITISDFDNDGRNDILHNGYQGQNPVVFYNTGNNTYQRIVINAGGASRPTQLYPADMNGDDRLDFLLSRDDASDQLNWFINNGRYENPDFTRQLISNNVFSAMDIKAFDADNDGDLDAVSASSDDNRIAVYYHLFADNDFDTLILEDQLAGASIDRFDHTVDLTVHNNTNLSKLKPTFRLSLKATATVEGTAQISGISQNDFSGPVTYKVIAENGSGQDWTVFVHPLPATPVLNMISVFTTTGANVNWTNGTFTDVSLLDISINNFATLITGFSAKEVAGSSFDITGLTPGTLYQVRIKGKNAFGESEEFSNVLTFTTIPSAPVLNPLANIGQTTCTASWQKTTGATSYLVDVSKDNFSTFIQPYNAFEVSSSNIALTGLSEGTNYQIRVRSINTSGASANSAPLSFATIPSNPLAVPATLITATSFTANWNSVTGASSYMLELSLDNFSTILSSNLVASGNLLAFMDLTSGSIYSYRVRAINSIGLSSGNSNIITLVTLPLAPSLDPVSGVTQTAATLNWQRVAGASAFQLDLSKDNFSTFIQPYNNFNVSSNNFQLNDLTPGTTYQYRIRSSNASGTAPNFATSMFTTIPPNPINKEASSKTSTSFTANWEVAATATSYTVELSDNNFTSILKTTATATNSFDFNGLTLGKSYAYRVRATNESGTSGNSNAVIVVPSYSVTITNESFNSNAKTASVTATSSAGIDSVKLFYRGIASGEYKSKLVPLASGTTYDVNITPDMEDEMGTEYYFEVKDGLADKRTGAISYYYKQLGATEKVSIPFARSGRGASNFNFFSIPYVLNDPNIQSIFEPVLGAYQDTKWRLIRYQDGRNVDYGDGLNKLEPGLGYWFASLNKTDVSINSANVVTANRTLPYALNLQKGWNQIGNPLPFDVSWADVLLSNADISGVSKLYVFDAGSFKKGDLKLFGGGFVKSERDVVIKIPVTVKRTTSGRINGAEITNEDISQTEWMVPLTIQQADATNDLAAIGMHVNASLGNDEFDEQSLPRFINYLELNSYHPEYFMPRFMRDIVPTAPYYNWSVQVESNYDKANAELRWDNLALGNNTAQLILFDMEARQFVDMKQFSSYRFDLSGKRSLKFFYSIDKEHFSPDVDGVGQAYPNPFEFNTAIPFVISKNNTGVICTVYDLMGRLVNVVASQQANMGYHEAHWDGTDSHGIKVSPGVYLYRVAFSDSPTQTGKVILK